MHRDQRVSVVIPALNEGEAIGRVLADIPAWVDQIIVADNGSTDGTADEACGGGATVVHEPRRGYGSACLKAMAALERPDIVVFLDGDYSDYPAEMEAVVQPIVAGDADLVIGSRVLGDAAPGALITTQRFGNWLSCLLIRLIWGVRFSDLGPFRAIRFDALQKLNMRDPDFGWTVEMQVKAAQQGLRVTEVPVSYRPRIGRSKVSGTVRGVWGAGTKILYTIFAAALRRQRPARSAAPACKLVVYTRYPEPGKVKTRLIPALGREGAAQLHQEMTRRTLATARELARRTAVVPEVHYSEGDPAALRAMFGSDLAYVPQQGRDLGQRMQATFQAGLTTSADRLIIIGTDCPAITPALLKRAFEALDRHDAVFGPARDGGYYLVGLRRPMAALFAGVPWGTDRVLAETLQRVHTLGISHTLLEELPDVDRPADLVHWRAAATQSDHT